MSVGILPGAERPGRELDLSPPTRIQFKNQWLSTFTATVGLHGVERVTILPFSLYC